MRRFELVEGKSSKFWEVETDGNKLTVRYGRIGTNGQTQTKEFADAAAAIKERDKLVKEKTGKGYGEIAIGAGATLVAVVPKADKEERPAETAESQAATAAQTAVPESAPVPAAPGLPAGSLTPEALSWPSGGFLGNGEEDRARFTAVRGEPVMPVLRGRHCPPFETQAASIASLPKFGGCHRRDSFLDAMAQACGRPWQCWPPEETPQRLTRENLSGGDFEWWLEAAAQCVANDTYGISGSSKWIARLGIALHGTAFMLDILVKLFRALPNHHGLFCALEVLRHAIAADDEAHFASAFALADAACSEATLPALAYLFPQHQPWVEQVLAGTSEYNCRLLETCVMSVEQLTGLWRKYGRYALGDSAIRLQVELHGTEVMPLLAEFLAEAGGRGVLERAIAWIESLRCPEQIGALMNSMEDAKETRAALDRIAAAHPAATLYTAIGEWHKRRSRMLEGWTLRLAERKPAALAQALAALPAAQAAAWRQLVSAFDQAEAPADALPAVLRDPPWLRKVRPQALPTLELPLLPTSATIAWADGEEAQSREHRPNDYRASDMNRALKENKNHPLVKKYAGDKTRLNDLALLFYFEIKDEVLEEILAGRPIQSGDLIEKRWNWERPVGNLLLASPALRLHVWNTFPAHRLFACWEDVSWLLAEHGPAALPGFVAYAQSHVEEGLDWGLPVDAPELASLALHALRNLKKAKEAAQQWIVAHPRTAAIVALKEAFGKDKAGRDNGAFGLRWLMRQGQEALIDGVAAEYDAATGLAATAALAVLKSADPLNVLPTKMPKLPTFFSAVVFRRPQLKAGGSLPLAAAEHIGTMLAISKLEAPYPGIDIVRELCTPDSLAEFAWDLFEAWLVEGAPSKENWAFNALGLLGNNGTVHRLTPKIREWPGESAHARAVAGLDILNAIGTDLALMSLNAIANKVKFKGLQEKAKEKIAAIAEARGLSTDELADRLVPDLGLDVGSALTLDFGPRQFTVAFDETLKPFVKDAQGARLKDLPKPIRSDDAELAAAATERYKALKKDAKAIASMQVTRLELAMVAQRRWNKEDFELFFLDHPVMRFLSARLVWGVYADGRFVEGFRIAEDWTLADANDALYTLPETASIGIAHVLTMPAEVQAAFGQIFADYEILQPFRQLGREIYTLTADELQADKIVRFAQKTVSTGSVLGLVNRGWERGDAQDGGWVGDFIKPLGAGLCAVASLDPGTVVGDLSYEPTQRIPEVTVHRVSENRWNWGDPLPLSDLDPVMTSELLRDIDLLAPYQEK